ncbi:chitin deacetylase 7-like [Gigantopelta aegis]|uniref:chitin deacetylase 7-like n=1 Tax=Gigantopelta aegis TaxID=1735272 RepID=UPI001B88D2E1|nr:chitin deacetylase 7-like [Gigantopelta aegis]
MVIMTVNCSNCHQGANCRLPQCSCTSYSSPLPVKDTPQIIFYGFDDALNGQMAQHYRKLFSSDRKNPNDCPISMSLYVQHDYTDYSLVREFYKKGMEIGVHSVTHTNIDTEAKLADEAEHQKSNLAQLGSVPKEEIIGWRSPNLETAGDTQPMTLKKLGYTYDISLTYTVRKRHEKKPWPYTMDYGYPYYCEIPPCPKPTSGQKGFWEVPIIAFLDYKGAYPCAYVDGCSNSPTTEEDAFEFLWENFEDNYETRTPLGFSMHAAWFERPHNLAAMDRFIKEMTKKDDVYIVSVQKMLEWMKHPTKLSELYKLKAWGCKSASIDQQS